jgi:hypothetical protein
MNDEPVEVFRLRLSRGTSRSSMPDWKIYEDRRKFEGDLLNALIEAKAAHDSGEPTWRAFRSWLHNIIRSDGEERQPVTRVIGAEQLIDGYWTKLNVHVEPPRLVFEDQEEPTY